MISGVHTEVVLSASYAIFLTTVAVGLELLARHSHKRSERYRNSGFTYFRDRDAWECPQANNYFVKRRIMSDELFTIGRGRRHVTGAR